MGQKMFLSLIFLSDRSSHPCNPWFLNSAALHCEALVTDGSFRSRDLRDDLS
jgi:hypothetical protein